MEIYDRNINKNNRNRLIRYMKMKDIAIFMDNALLLIFFSIGIIKYICYIIYYLLVINVLLFVFYKNLHFI